MSGFTDGLNSLGQMGDSFLHGAEKASGEVIDAGAHVVASGLNGVGLHSWATSVTEIGDSAAASLGATVPEQQLGESDKPSDLIHGDVKAIRASAQHLHRFATAFDETGRALKDLDTGHWRGEAADAFRASYTPHPAKWIDAADACESAATALDSYADTVEWAQGQAAHAIDAYNAAQQASQSARTAYNQRVEAFNAVAERGMTLNQQPPGPPGPFHDPGQAAVNEAREILTEARRQRDSQAEAAQRTIAQATKLAPTTPSFTTRLLDDYADGMAGETLTLEHVGGGVIKGLGGMVKFAHGLDPTNPYNLANPGTYLDHVTTTAAGLLHSANHPVDLVKSLAGSGWTKDPGEALGRLLANIATGTLTDGGSTAEAAAADVEKNVAAHTTQDAVERSVSADTTAAVHPVHISPTTARVFQYVKDLGNRPGITIFRKDSPEELKLRMVSPESGFYDVGIHGAPDEVGLETIPGDPSHLEGMVLTPKELIDVMKTAGWNGEPVRLLSCSTGKDPDGFAQQMSNQLGVPVKAPNDLLWVNGEGEKIIAPPDEKGDSPHPTQRGDFITFYPQNIRPTRP